MKDEKTEILSNERVIGDYYKMALAAPWLAKSSQPGQFVQIRVSDGFDPLLRRPFSVHRLKVEGSRLKGVEILYEVIGRGTEILAKKRKGDILDVLGPLGNGFSLPRASSLEPRTILVCGGIGVAPLVFLAEKLKERRIKTTVLIGANTKKIILCDKDFKELGCEVHVATDDGSKGHKGFVSELFLATSDKRQRRRGLVYACGPELMLEAVMKICRKKKIPCQVSLEERMACGIGACLGCAVETKSGIKMVCKDGPVFDITEL